MYHNQGIEIDVDGSYHDGKVGYAFVVRNQGKEIYHEAGLVPPDVASPQHRNVSGEIYAVVQALRWCHRNKIPACTLYYDYEGLAAWAQKKWKTRSPLTQRYVTFVQNCPVRIHWQKVPAHKGHTWNKKADELARKATETPNE
ncbi:MAG: RNase H family protein [Bacteroidia bacterium]